MIQKQALKWPVSVCRAPSLQEDVILRNVFISKKALDIPTDPFAVKLNLDDNLLSEYGIDCCRMALIAANGQQVLVSHLESAHKWLAKFYQSFFNCGPDRFDISLWLETLCQSQDHLQQRADPYSALTLVRKALKLAGINATTEPQQLHLALLSLYPLAPFLVYYLAGRFNLLPLPSVETTIASFPDLTAVRFRIKNSGWHWRVFDREKFTQNPAAEFKTVKWVALAAQNRHINVCILKEGYEICLI